MISDKQALAMLLDRGYAVSRPDVHAGYVRVWIRDSEEGVDVRLGRELHELAEERLTLEDVWARREDETVARRE
jgi:hypothetical protein